MKIMGLDPSINSSGRCVMDLDDDTFDIKSVKFYGSTTTRKYCMSTPIMDIKFLGKDYEDMDYVEKVTFFINTQLNEELEGVKYIGMEGYAFMASKSNSLFQIGEYIGCIKKHLYDSDKAFISYPPTVVKKFASGHGNADKMVMVHALQQFHPQWYPKEMELLPQYKNPHSDLCDAFFMGDVLRNHIKFEKFGPDVFNEHELGTLTGTSTKTKKGKKVMSIIDNKLIKKA